MDLFNDFARFHWAPPHLIPELAEPHVEEIEALLPLDVPLMERMPSIDARDFALPIRVTQGPVEDYVDAWEDTRDWDEFEGLYYVGVEDHYEWSLVEPEDDHLEDEIPVDNNDSAPEVAAADEIVEDNNEETELRLAAASKHQAHPITNDDTSLLQGINPGASHIATIGLHDAIAPSFGPILEPRLHQ